MTQSTPTIEQLQSLPWSERRDALESLVVDQFRATLLMDDDEDLPLDESYFELGFTSLRITEIKQRLEDLLGCEISTTMLFNTPTIEQLLEHLVEDGLAALFAEESDS
jgi:acyl carrier protein